MCSQRTERIEHALPTMQSFLKRLFDTVIAAVLLVVLSPVLLAISVAIKLSSRGPAIFTQERAGKHGKPFAFYKFRTMRFDVDPFGPSPKSGADPRLTRIGKFLREYSLDELPQLVNIVTGDMSLVGPRPLYVSQTTEWDGRQKKRLLVRPGLTGLAQISGRGTLTREEKLELDVRYVERGDIRMDVRILAATVAQVFGRSDIYEKRYSEVECIRGEKISEREKGRKQAE